MTTLFCNTLLKKSTEIWSFYKIFLQCIKPTNNFIYTLCFRNSMHENFKVPYSGLFTYFLKFF